MSAPNPTRPLPRPLLSALLLIALLLGAAAEPALARDDEGKQDVDEIDYLALAARLLRDGHADRAQAALGQVNLKDPQLDRRRLHTLRGLTALSLKGYQEAAKAFEAAIAAPPTAGEVPSSTRAAGPDPALLLYLAQAYFGFEEFESALRTLDRAGKTLDEESSAYLIRAQANWKLTRPEPALQALSDGEERFVSEPSFVRLQVFYLVELGLFQRGTEVGQRYLKRAEATAEDFIAVAEALRRGKQPAQAGLLLEGAHLRYPTHPRVALALAHTYIDRARPLSAAMLLEDVARREPQYAVEAAELYKRAGRLSRALSLNERVHDQAAKFRQRLAILVEMERFELVAGMASTLDRLGLLSDDPVRYALAYALYKIGDFEGSDTHLNRLTQSSLIESANQLRKAMARCRESGWECT